MKNILCLFLFVASFNATSQPYSLTVSSSAYSPLTGATNISSGIVWSYATSFTVPMGFTFNFMGNNYSTIYVEGGGFTYFDPSYYYILLPFGVALKDKGTGSPLSPISHKTEGVAPNRICKIEWSNADYYNNPGSTANFQLWLYETTNVMEVHVGNCTVSNPSLAYSWNSANGPSIGIYEYNSTTLLYGFGLTGLMATPTENNNLSGPGINPFDYSLSQTPFSGTMYRFSPDPSAVNHTKEKKGINVYYNSNEQQVKYNSVSEIIEKIEVVDVQGRLNYTAEPNNLSGGFSLNSKGIFIVKLAIPGSPPIITKIVVE